MCGRFAQPRSAEELARIFHAVRLTSGDPMAFAGLWAVWRNPDTAERLYTVSILTSAPNRLVAQVHDRMPVILDPQAWDAWLGESTPFVELRALLRPAPADGMRMYGVSPAVNHVRSEGPELLAPLSRWQSELWPA